MDQFPDLLNMYQVLHNFFQFGKQSASMGSGFFPTFVISAVVLFFVVLAVVLLLKVIKAVLGLISGLIGGLFGL